MTRDQLQRISTRFECTPPEAQPAVRALFDELRRTAYPNAEMGVDGLAGVYTDSGGMDVIYLPDDEAVGVFLRWLDRERLRAVERREAEQREQEAKARRATFFAVANQPKRPKPSKCGRYCHFARTPGRAWAGKCMVRPGRPMSTTHGQAACWRGRFEAD